MVILKKLITDKNMHFINTQELRVFKATVVGHLGARVCRANE